MLEGSVVIPTHIIGLTLYHPYYLLPTTTPWLQLYLLWGDRGTFFVPYTTHMHNTYKHNQYIQLLWLGGEGQAHFVDILSVPKRQYP